MKKKLPWIKFPKGTTKREKAIRLDLERAKLGLDPYVKPVEKSIIPDNRHGSHECYITQRTFSNHTTHYGLFCAECEHHPWIAWIKRDHARELIQDYGVEYRSFRKHLQARETYVEPEVELNEPLHDPNYRTSGLNKLPNI